MAISSGYSSSRRLTISRGDQRFRSFSRTYRRRRSSCINRLLPWLREEARTCARLPAENARYPLFPLLCCTSRATVLGARPNRRAMTERPVPCARPRLISSRSVDESRRYSVVVCIRIHSTHIRCVKCLTPSSEYASGFLSLRPHICQQLLRLATKDYSDRLLVMRNMENLVSSVQSDREEKLQIMPHDPPSPT
jgi:hypothetical protein